MGFVVGEEDLPVGFRRHDHGRSLGAGAEPEPPVHVDRIRAEPREAEDVHLARGLAYHPTAIRLLLALDRLEEEHGGAIVAAHGREGGAENRASAGLDLPGKGAGVDQIRHGSGLNGHDAGVAVET